MQNTSLLPPSSLLLRQAGCILYAMLAGHPPFHPDVKYRSLCAKGKFYPLKGPNWDSISAEAKDLVTKMLTKDPAARIDMDGICNHPWLVAAGAGERESLGQEGQAEKDKAFGEAYTKRIKNLVLKNKLKKCFLDTNIADETKNRRANFVKTLSTSDMKSPDNPFDATPPREKSYCVAIEDYVKTSEYNAKLLKVRAALVQHIFSKSCLLCYVV
jgi:serine/threonine protein kinase